MLHVCSLAALPDTVKATGASHVLTVMANVDQVQRPVSVLPANHLKVAMDDITEQVDGFVAPSEQHIEKVLAFVRGWDRSAPLVVHCYAGISRSTASAFAAACMLNPHRDEMSIARQIRAASPIAQPNRLIVSLADKVLGRDGHARPEETKNGFCTPRRSPRSSASPWRSPTLRKIEGSTLRAGSGAPAGATRRKRLTEYS